MPPNHPCCSERADCVPFPNSDKLGDASLSSDRSAI